MTKTLAQALFPVPKILKPSFVGFDMTTDSVKFFELDMNAKGAKRILRFGEESLPADSVKGGEITNSGELCGALREIHKKHGFKNIAVSLPEEKSYVFTMYIPAVSPEELRESIYYQLEEHVPVSIDSVVFDYEVVGTSESKNELEVSVAALPKGIAESYYGILEECGFLPLLFETEAQALARALYPKNEYTPYLVVDFGNTSTVISIVSGGVVLFNATLELGGRDITRGLVKDLNVSFEEAEKLKWKNGISYDKKDGIFSSTISALAVLRDEINKYIAYWNERGRKGPEGDRIELVLVSGGSAALKGLIEFLGIALDVPVERANVWTNVLDIEKEGEIPPIEREESLRYATAIGLALNTPYND